MSVNVYKSSKRIKEDNKFSRFVDVTTNESQESTAVCYGFVSRLVDDFAWAISDDQVKTDKTINCATCMVKILKSFLTYL